MRTVNLVVLYVFLLFSIILGKEFKIHTKITSPDEAVRFGMVLADIGDINGDGLSDLLIGAEGGYKRGDYAGKAFIYLGNPQFSNRFSFVLVGEGPGDYFGCSATTLGDVNGDGFDDFAVGARQFDAKKGVDAGKVYIFYGGKKISDTANVTILGRGSHNYFGASLAGGKDINGDKKPDLIVGAPFGGSKYSGAVYIYLSDHGFEEPALILEGEEEGDAFGSNVAMIDDMNGDGIADFVVSAVSADPGDIENAGKIYVYAGGSVIKKDPIITYAGSNRQEQLGYSLCSPGDLNNDGFADLLVGGIKGGNGTGVVLLFLGGNSIRSEPAVTYYGQHQNDMFGYSISPAGDVDGDGFKDFMVGAPYKAVSSYHNGKTFFFGGGKKFSDIEIQFINGSGEEDQCGAKVLYVPSLLGKNSPAWIITFAGPGTATEGKSTVYIYK